MALLATMSAHAVADEKHKLVDKWWVSDTARVRFNTDGPVNLERKNGDQQSFELMWQGSIDAGAAPQEEGNLLLQQPEVKGIGGTVLIKRLPVARCHYAIKADVLQIEQCNYSDFTGTYKAE